MQTGTVGWLHEQEVQEQTGAPAVHSAPQQQAVAFLCVSTQIPPGQQWELVLRHCGFLQVPLHLMRMDGFLSCLSENANSWGLPGSTGECGAGARHSSSGNTWGHPCLVPWLSS